MGDYTESDSEYLRGHIEGYVQGISRYIHEDTSFDQDRWEAQYGSRVVYDGFPAWPSTEARKRGEDPFVLCDWEDSTETSYLKEGVDLPSDRAGTIVFADGTAVRVTSGRPQMFTLSDYDTELIKQWKELSLEMLREAYDYESS